MPKMTHPFNPESVDVADEKVAVYQAQGYSLEDAATDDSAGVSRESLKKPAKKTAKKAAKKS